MVDTEKFNDIYSQLLDDIKDTISIYKKCN